MKGKNQSMDRSELKARPDAERRERQSDRIARVVMVHRMMRAMGGEATTTVARVIASELDVSERTIFRDMAVLNALYKKIGSSLLDG
jgi:hypothetical protein